MKKYIAKITLFSLVAAALVAVPTAGRAEDATNTPATNAPAKKRSSSLPFHGAVASVDATAMTFTVGTMTIAVTSTTKITKDDKPAVFADITVGETVSGSYKKDAAGKLNASSVKIGQKKKKGTPAA